MKLIDKAIDYVTNRVLDRVDERKPQQVNVTNNVSWTGMSDAAKRDLERQWQSTVQGMTRP